MKEEAKRFLKECLEIYSPSGQENDYTNFIANFLKKYGFKVNFDKIGNLIAEKGKGKPVLLLVSHLDTSPGMLPVTENEGKIFGRGAIDCKPSLASLVYSICKYDFDKWKEGTVIFAGIVREKDSAEGIEEFIKSNITPDYAIIGEPTKVNQICIGYKGRLCIGYKVLSTSGHVASSWQYVNSIEIALEVWKMVKGVCWQLTEAYCKKDKSKKYYNQIIPNLTIISGGQRTDYVPNECIIQIDIRFPPSISLKLLVNEIRSSVLNFKNAYQQSCKVEFRVQENISSLMNAYEVEGDILTIGALRWAIFQTIKEKARLIRRTGTKFINAIGMHYGVPSISYGPGELKKENMNQEFIDIDEYLSTIEIYSKFYDKFYEIYEKEYKNSN
ncbi:MAG: M20/M25/M40 family metallo-hydrolase [Promethearchaeota archaeon]